MACNCNTASKTCDPCAFCTPPGVTGLTTCQPIDPCEDKLPIDCVLYTGQPYDCEVTVTENESLTSILVSLFQYFATTPSTNECCGIEGDVTFTNITTTTSSTTTTSTTTTTTTLPPECSFYNIHNSNPTVPAVVEYYLCGCELPTTSTINEEDITVCLQNPINITTISGTISTPTNLGVCGSGDVICPTTTTTTAAPVCTCNIYTVTNSIRGMISHTYTECTPSGNVLVTTGFADGEWQVCACSDILENVPAGLTISVAGASCTAPPTTTTTTIDCTNSGGTVTLLESFTMNANLVTEIKFHIINTTVAFRIDWGDGTTNTYSPGSLYHTVSHTYTGSYSGPIVFYSTDLTGITDFYDADYSSDPSAPLWPGFNCLAGGSLSVTASELGKLDGCDTMEILNTKTTGDINDLPNTLVRLVLYGNGRPGSANCNNTLSGDIANTPPLATTINILGENTLTGDIGNLPTPPGITGGYYLAIRGNNTVWGDIQNLPSGVVPPATATIDIRGFNTITGDIATIPPDYTSITVMGGNDTNHTDAYGNTIWGDINTIGLNVTVFNIRGDNTLTGNLGSIISTSLLIFYIRGKSTIYGNINDIIAPNLRTLVLIDDLNLTSVTGDLSTLDVKFPLLTTFEITGPQTVTGSIGGIPNTLINYKIAGPAANLSGTFSDLTSKTNLLQWIYSSNACSIDGNVADLPSSIKLFNYQTLQTGLVITFTPPHTWANPMHAFTLLTGTAMSTTNINNLLVSLASVPTWAIIPGVITYPIVVKLKGTPTGAGLTAISTLTSNGVTVTITP